MARSGFPSMTALLGLLAVAGYQNRDRIGTMLNNRGAGGVGGMGGMGGGGGGGLGDLLGGALGGQGGRGRASGLDGLLGGLAGGGLGGLLGGGLGELNSHMRTRGRGDAMDSWVGTGPNHRLEPHDLEHALGPEVIADLQEHTGLDRDEILSRLSRELPDAVDRYTPDGRLPDRSEF